jgi:hypothetical protein
MDRASAASIGASSRYAVLAANVSKVVMSSGKRALEPAEKKLLYRAAELVDKIVQGSKFIEHKEAHVLSKPHENLFAFDHAMSALRISDLSPDAKAGLTDLFAKLREDLHRIAEDENIEENSKTTIKGFFDALGELFYRDIANSSVIIQESNFEKTLT